MDAPLHRKAGNVRELEASDIEGTEDMSAEEWRHVTSRSLRGSLGQMLAGHPRTLSSPQAEAVVVREVLHLAKVAFASGYTTQTPGIGKPQGGGGEGALPQSRS